MTNSDILSYLRQANRPVYFSQIANWFPGESEEAELYGRLRLLVRTGFVRRLEGGKIEVIKQK